MYRAPKAKFTFYPGSYVFEELLGKSNINPDEISHHFNYFPEHCFSEDLIIQALEYCPSTNRLLLHLQHNSIGWTKVSEEQLSTNYVIDDDTWHHICERLGSWKEGYNNDVIPEVWVQAPIYEYRG